jgi:hypothetical protein
MNETTFPYDIITSPLGFFVLSGSKAETKFWVALYNYNGTLIWKRKINNNKSDPT